MAENAVSAEPRGEPCAKHPKIETVLHCGRCETPICPHCLIQTPVGARCRSCARMRRLPMYDVTPRFLLRGALAGLAAGTAGSIAVFLGLAIVPFLGLFGMLLFGALYGYVVSEAISLATNRKRGRTLSWTAVASILVGVGLGRAILLLIQSGQPVLARLPEALLVGFLGFQLPLLLLQLVAALIAFTRLR